MQRMTIISGVINVLMTTPLWVVNTRLKVQGAKFETENYQEEKKVQYKGIIGKLNPFQRTTILVIAKS